MFVVASAVVAQVSTSVDVANAADGTVTGTVYQDFNSNGANDTAVASGQATDIGIAGITVKAFDSTGALVGETTSGASGNYTLTMTGAATSAVRVEFSLPTSGPLAAMKPSFAGTQNGTTIRFVDIGATAVDIGFNVPGEFCQNNPNLSISRLCAGAGASVDSSASAWVTRYDGGPYTTAHGFSDRYADWSATKVATKSETGSILGMTWDPSTRKVYHSAYVRRHAELFESGGVPRPAAIFQTTPTGTTSAQGVGGTTSFLVDLESLIVGDQFSNSNPAGPGYIPTNAVRQIQYMANGNTATGDGGADNDGVDSDLVAGKDGVFEEVGKAGIGDIETDGRGKLWAVSLYDKNLYQVTLPATGAPTAMVSLGDITSGVTCTNGSGRPFSVRLWRGSLYLGVVCDGAGDFNAASPGTLNNSNVTFTIRRYDLAGGTWSTAFGPQRLDAVGGVVKGMSDTFYGLNTRDNWNPWTDIFSTADDSRYLTRPTPMLSEIEFDRDGSMILGFRDRNGDQQGTNDSENPEGGNTNFPTLASGDIYRVCRTGSGFSVSDYVFEGGAGCPQSSETNYGTEFYKGDAWKQNATRGHGEISAGMLEQVPGFPSVMMTGYDPYDADGTGKSFYSGGVRWLSNATGGAAGSPNSGSGVMFYNWDGEAGNPNKIGGFLKTNGMSDVEALCDQAPLQIGNRVWIDTDKDGIQDPGETPVAGATVRLYDAAGTLVGTAITNASGEYYFASNVTEPAAGDANNVGGGLAVDAAFTVKLDNPADYAAGGPLNGYTLTSTDSTTTVATDADNAIDNDSALAGGSTYGVDRFPSISVAAHGPGENDHTFDFGFITPVVPVGMGNYTWIDTDKDGLQDADEVPLAGVVVTLYNPDGTAAKNLAGGAATATTDTKGYYFIDNLAAGNYYAKFTLPANHTFTKKGDGSSVLDSNPDTATGITPVFTIAASVSGETVTDTDSTTLAQFVNPTIDAGVIFNGPKVSVGDYVWWDLDRDGIQDKGETPIAGVTLTITKADGSPVTDVNGKPVTTTVTDANGKYSFDNLPLGQYKVTVTPPSGATATKARSGKNVAKDSSTGAATSRNMTTDGDRDPTLDFGFYKPSVSLGNRVWRDTNGDGIQSRADKGLGGFKLTLRTVDGQSVTDVYGRPVKPVRTKADGSYLFKDLPPGQYVVEIAYPKGYLPTTAGRPNKSLNSSTLYAKSKLLADGQVDTTLDFGVVSRPGQRFQLLPATR